MAFDTITVPEFDSATSLNLTDLLWLTQGIGASQDKKVDLTLLKEFLNTDITLTGTLIHGTSYTVSTQVGFNDLIERVSANTYKFKDAITAIHLRHLTGGYLCYGGTSFLSDGDTWGMLQINNVENFTADYGTYLAIGDTNFYISLNGSDKYLKNIWLKGIGSTAITGQYSFKIESGVGGIIFDTCKVSDRYVGTTNAHYVFAGESPVNKYTKLLSCTVSNMQVDTEYLFCYQYFNHADNCIIDNMLGGGTTTFGFASMGNISNCRVIDSTMSSGGIYCFYQSMRINSCWINNITTPGSVEGFSNTDNINNCIMEYCTSTGTGRVRAFDTINQASNCLTHDLTTNSGECIAYSEVEGISNCRFHSMSTTSGTVQGYYWCKYGSSLRGVSSYSNTYNDYIDTADTDIVNKNSTADLFQTGT